jgi:diguanylate cyclase (GGDEF)-like protein
MDQFQDFEHRVLRLIALLGACFAFFLTFYYMLWIGNKPIGVACLTHALVSTGVFASSHRRPDLARQHGRLIIAVTTMVIWTGVYFDSTAVGNDPWMVMFPALVFSLSGPRPGSMWITVALLGMILIRLVQPNSVPLASVLNTTFAYVTTAIIVGIFAVQNRKNVRLIRQLGNTDSLTGALNRRTFAQTLEDEFHRNLRQGTSMTVFMVDVDHFKSFNDRYGHVEGDDVLVKVAQALKHTARRAGEYVFRYGGEEFCVLCSTLDDDQAEAFAEQLRLSVAGLALEHDGSPIGLVSVSVGYRFVKLLEPLVPTVLVEQADKALYLAKALGRNRVERYLSAAAA